MSDTEEKKPKKPIRLATLDDLEIGKWNVVVELGLNEAGEMDEVLIPLNALSYYQVQQIRADIKDPMPPMAGHRDGGIPVYNFSDPAYLAERNMKEAERMHAFLLAAWPEDKIPLPGATDAEKIEHLKFKLTASVVRQLLERLQGLIMEGNARVEARAATFQEK